MSSGITMKDGIGLKTNPINMMTRKLPFYLSALYRISTVVLSFFIPIAVWCQTAPIPDQEARSKYDQCWKYFEADKIKDCYVCCLELRQKMGRPTLKVNTLLAESGGMLVYNSLDAKADRFEGNPDNVIKLNYKNLSVMNGYLEELTALLGSGDTLVKHKVLKEFQGVVRRTLDEYESEKDR